VLAVSDEVVAVVEVLLPVSVVVAEVSLLLPHPTRPTVIADAITIANKALVFFIFFPPPNKH
jgi:hypothetical protein